MRDNDDDFSQYYPCKQIIIQTRHAAEAWKPMRMEIGMYDSESEGAELFRNEYQIDIYCKSTALNIGLCQI